MLTLIAQFGSQGLQPDTALNRRFLVDVGSADTSSISTMESLISFGIGLLTVLASLFFIVYFVMGAFKWTAAGGDSGKVSKARDEMIQSVLGLILIVAAYAVIGLVGTVLGLNILEPGKALEAILEL